MTWETVPLGEIARLDARAIQPADIPADTKYVGLEHIGAGGELDMSTSAGAAGLKSAKNQFTPDHILYGKLRPNLGKVARPSIAGVCSTDIYPIRPSNRVDRGFLAHFLLTPATIEYSASRTTGVNLPRVSWKVLEDLAVPLPPLPEQRRIAAILDETDNVRSAQNHVLGSCEALAEAAFRAFEQKLGSRPTTALGDIADVSSGITKGRKPPADDLQPIDYMTVANVQDKWLDLSAVKQIEVSPQEIDRYRLRDGDLLLTEGGDPDKLGRGVVWRDELPVSIHQNHVFRVRLKGDVLHPLWLNWEIGSAYGKRYFLRAAKQTTGIATINSSQLRAFPVRVPAPNDVVELLTRLNEIRALRSQAATRSITLDSLFASLQHRAFRGEL